MVGCGRTLDEYKGTGYNGLDANSCIGKGALFAPFFNRNLEVPIFGQSLAETLKE